MKKCASSLLLFPQMYGQVQCNFIYIRPQTEYMYTTCLALSLGHSQFLMLRIILKTITCNIKNWEWPGDKIMMEYVNSPSISINATLAVLLGNHTLKAQLSIAENLTSLHYGGIF